jgi:chromosome segregation ATPase
MQEPRGVGTSADDKHAMLTYSQMLTVSMLVPTPMVARAGEQGRGFAVVAGEVRNLAQRSAQAAREIKSLIGESVQKVETGSKLVNDAGQTMSDIVAQVKRVTDLIGEITSSTLEQSNGIGQVNQAVTQLDQMTQQNAALVEQSAAAAESLKEQADKLAKAVAIFKLSRSEARQVIAEAQAASRNAIVARAAPAPKARPADVAEPRPERGRPEADPAPRPAAGPAQTGR